MIFLRPFFLFLMPLSFFPIILHLLGKRLERRKPFPWVSLLMKTEAEGRRVNRIYEWLILIARSLIIFFVILAFSGPVTSRIRSVDAILVDVSHSITPHREKVEEILDKLEERFPNISPIYFADEILDIRSFKTTYRSTDYTVLRGLGNLERPVIISDFQKTGAKGSVSFKGSPYLVNLSEKIKNVGIVGVKVKVPYVFPGSGLKVKVKIRNYSDRALRRGLVIKSNGVPLLEREIFVDSSSTSIVEMEFPSRGSRYFVSIVNGDDIPGDDSYYLLVPSFKDVNVILLGKRENLKFVKAALSPGRIKSPFKVIELERVKTFGQISGSDLVVVMKGINDMEYNYLERYIEEGGRIMVFYYLEPFNIPFEEKEEGYISGYKEAYLAKYRIIKEGSPLQYDKKGNRIGVSLRDGRLFLYGWYPYLQSTNFIYDPDFVPFIIREIASLVGLERYFYGVVGKTIEIPISKAGVYTILSSTGFRWKVEGKERSGERYLELGPFEEPGFYSVFKDGNLDAYLAINFDPGEGNPESLGNKFEIFKKGELLDLTKIKEKSYSQFLFLSALLFAFLEMGLVYMRRKLFR